jgi:hypothetical protein
VKTVLTILAGVGVGGVLGALIGYLIGELAVELFDISCFEGGCGYAVVLYALLGIVIGAAGGGVLFYKMVGPNSKISVWFLTLLGALLGGAAAQLLLIGLVKGVVWFLNSGIPGESAAQIIAAVYNVFTYLVLLVGVVGGGWLSYKLALGWANAAQGG